MRRHLFIWLGPLCSLLLLGAALAVLYRLTHLWHWHDIRLAIWSLPLPLLGGALLLTLLSYACLCCYDMLAVHALGKRLPWQQVGVTSFIAYTFSNTLGFALLTGSSVRYRIYSSLGLGTGEVARIIVFCSVTFFLGLLAWGGTALLVGQATTLLPDWPLWADQLLNVAGGLALLAVLGYLFWPKPALVWRGHELVLPVFRTRLLQLLVALLDWMAAAAVLYVLLPADSVSYPVLLSAFVLASFLGVLAHVPGGIGVFEASMSLLLAKYLPVDKLLASLLLYRCIYYVLPFLCALLLFTSQELLQQKARWSRLQGIMTAVREFLPALISLGAFAAGSLLLCSGMIPTMRGRIEMFLQVLPLHLLELSHVLGSVSGVLLILLARSLYRRHDAAFRITQLLLGLGMIFSLLKGFDWESALLLGLFLLIITPCRSLFYRKGSLLHAQFTPGWLISVGAVLLGALWLLLFSYRQVEYDHALWFHFSPHGAASRGLRAMGSVVAVLAVVGVAQLLAPLRVSGRKPEAEELARAHALVLREGGCHGYLAQLGDKSLLFHPGGEAFLMYGVEGNGWIVMGDPIGQPELIEELLWQFRELCDQHDASPVFYQVSARYLPLYLELGLIPFKLGEEAIVDLAAFELAGSRLRNLRQSHAKGKREGLSFEVVAPEYVPALLPRLKEVSDTWLQSKQGKEKGFSVGSFEPAYLSLSPAALVRHEGQIVGFANLWVSDNKESLSIDLMRYSLDTGTAPIMDFLFVELLLWGKAEGYASFNLGMAPMSGFNDHPLSGYWTRLGNTIFTRGSRFYNFQGLRRYKEKFSPDWEPRYLLCTSKLVLPRVLTNLISLISRGPFGLIKK
ncbi:bifunctional lysylphosphatidylglycerol flippase/synthetase MprF [Aeromonas hydrophila]|uniref:bifunctional lysylphosphatidylglycerol flippase/synthetase MprF n=1 Tax=Aeromonas hydrophila TaxID=644 RepID=UPI001A35E449|nr:bifunctional lysylphosphatidylglycerol flippase/synthetase MprF [Aeromonas hydrophila]MCP3242087.1 bifunctional lysylphosphatidylglycerol flippase/synthetase MprF [Aeromonas hydrophila]HAU4896418.1 bifunctional lysylphosphatidylglycerol flippase/synthetase MprF [Aeromonas hydrophila]HDU8490653.1 bifunctional lysylphosphatidylglycerol flippase/synthetase MprF [Aeromonas hydrophila]